MSISWNPLSSSCSGQGELLPFFLLCAEFSFPGPDDSSWCKYDEALAESHEGSEEEEGVEVPSTCESEARSFAKGQMRWAQALWCVLEGEILPSPWPLLGLPQGQRGSGAAAESTRAAGGCRSSWGHVAR